MPPALRDAFVERFASVGFRAAANTPFAGALVPGRFYRQEPRVQSVMVEMNRRLYLDETTGRPGKCFSAVATTVQTACIAAIDGL